MLFLIVTFLLSLAPNPAARAAALVGETTVRPANAIAPSEMDNLKPAFRRPATIPFPADNPYTPAKALLGRMLYYDTRLSGSDALACASCHSPGFAYGDGRAKAIGQDMKPLPRRSPSVINDAWGVLFMWDGRASSLERQALMPVQAPGEMNQPLDRMVGVLSGIAGYQPLFAAAFPGQPITPDTVAKAIATFERTIVSGKSAFDAWVLGDEGALSAAAKRGFVLFTSKARCSACHGGWNFTDDGFHDIGLPDDDAGRGRLFPNVLAMQHAFKTPSLRETARRGPYMHDGSLPTLEAVVAHYNRGGAGRPGQSRLVAPLGLTSEEAADLVAFLRTLTSEPTPGAFPELPQ